MLLYFVVFFLFFFWSFPYFFGVQTFKEVFVEEVSLCASRVY